jgi:hypothetical protein
MPVGRSTFAKPKTKAAGEGGSRAAGGLGFQANATAYFVAHLLTGQSLGGLSPLLDAVPVGVSSESGGAGDDLRIELSDGRVVEAQVKRGLKRGRHLWASLEALAVGVANHDADFGLLIVCPQASSPILKQLARDLVRLGDGRSDQLSPIGAAWRDRLDAIGLPISVCANIRISALAITGAEGADIRVAQGLLKDVLADPNAAARAWEVLAEDGDHLIEYRGRRTLETAIRAIDTRGIAFGNRADSSAPALLLQRLLAWTIDINATYEIVGIPSPLSIDSAWIKQYARVLPNPQSSPASYTADLQRYRAGASYDQESARTVHAATIGRLIPHSVVLAGPGMGKTTLLTKLARTYARDGYPVLKVRLRALAERLRGFKETFDEAIFALGLDKSGIDAASARASRFSNWVVLLDGLDECGLGRAEMARHLSAFAAAHPTFRIIVTSRSIGYEPGALSAWRHYEMAALGEDDVTRSVRQLVTAIELNVPSGEARTNDIAEIIKRSPAAATIAASPLLLGLATALAYRQGSIGRTETDLYQRIFILIEAAACERATKGGLTDVELNRTIDIIGHSLVSNPEETEMQTLDRVAAALVEELEVKWLGARRNCELALRYWCDLGLLEQIHHRGVEMLAFVHKTFGEFASARFIRAAEPKEWPRLLRRAIELQADPVVDFAAALGLGRHALAVLLDGKVPHPPETMVRALVLAGYATENDIQEVVEPLVKRAFQLIGGSTEEWRERIGAALAALALTHRETLVPLVEAHLYDESQDSRLAAWGIVLQAGADDISHDRLLAMISEITVTTEETEQRRPLLGGMRLKRNASSLLQDFVVAAVDHLLPSREAAADHAIVDVLKHPGLNSFGFVERIEPLFERHGRSDIYAAARAHWYRGKLDPALKNVKFKKYDEAAAVSEIAQLTALAGGATADPRITGMVGEVLPHLSAFSEMTRWGNTPANDVWEWADEDWRPVERAVLRTAARAGIVDSEKLAVEAASLLAIREKIKGHYTFALFRQIDAIDIPDVDWSRVAKQAPDLPMFEQALHHGSYYLVMLAANILDEILAENERRAVVERTLRTGRGWALLAGSGLAAKLPAKEAVELVLNRLEADPSYGAEHLFELFHSCPLEAGPRLESAMRVALYASRPEVAVAAADAILGTDAISDELAQILSGAIAHWSAHPPPRRTVGQAPDPRPAMADALAATGRLNDAELLRLLRFSRGDRSAIGNLSRKRWLEESAYRDAVFDAAERGDLLPSELRTLIEQPTALSAAQRDAVLRLARSKKAAMRRVVVDVFTWPHFLDDQTAPILDLLTEDPEPEICVAASRARSGQRSPV